MISLYQDIMISFEVILLDEKTKQVQVRLTPELHDKLKGNLALDGKKLVDFFNDAAKAYLNNKEEYEKFINESIGELK